MLQKKDKNAKQQIDNIDLFTSAANENFNKQIKKQSKKSLEIINSAVNWNNLIKSLEKIITKEKKNHSLAGRSSFDLRVIVKCFILQRIYNLSDPRLEEEIADRRSFQIFLD